MNISSEAVEAAARRVYLDSVRARKTCDAWESLADGEQSFYRFEAKRILEAAAPHLMAEAWDEGSEERRSWQWRDDAEPLTNPYRKERQ